MYNKNVNKMYTNQNKAKKISEALVKIKKIPIFVQLKQKVNVKFVIIFTKDVPLFLKKY